MPFIDLNTNAPLPDNVYDVTIVGAGAAGILLAVQLSRAGKKVLMIESGHFDIDEEKQKLNVVENTGKVLENAVWGRKRAIGGTTLAWGGQSLPFTAIDFSSRSWVQNSGWPVAYKEMAGYYHRANTFMGIDTLDYREDIFKRIKLKDPGIDPSIFTYHISKWADQPNFQILYKDYLNKTVTILYNCHLHKIYKEDHGSVSRIDVKNFRGETFSINITTLIIAAGGIESVRILLNNNIAGGSGWLGKCFMDHPCIELGEVVTGTPYRLQKFFNTHLWERHKYSIRLSLAEHFQRQNKLLNCSASILFVHPEDRFNPYSEIISFKKDRKLKRLVKLIGNVPAITRSIYALFKDRFYYKVNAVNKLLIMSEQEPVQESYISLSTERDEFNMPKALINWNITDKTWSTVLEISKALKSELERLQFGTVHIYQNVTMQNKEWINDLSDVNHHMGGSRMGSSPENSVVNENLQVWGVPNLYVCSSSVFPTSSHSNPTLTLLALGLRLSDFLLNK